jgi:hypothetical protein
MSSLTKFAGLASALAFTLLANTAGAQTCPPGTQQQTQTFTSTFGPTDPPWQNQLITVPQFNPGPGQTLIKAEITASAAVHGTIEEENTSTSGGGCDIVAQLESHLLVQYPPALGIPDLPLNPNVTEGPTHLGPFDGTNDFRGTSGMTFANLTGTDGPDTNSITDTTLLASVFTGAGNVTFTHSAVDASSHSGSCGNLIFVVLNQSQLTITVTYTYCAPITITQCNERHRRQCGSLLLYPEFRNQKGVLTLLTVTMGCCSPSPSNTIVEFRFIRGETCNESNQSFTLTPCDTVTMLTSAVNSGGPGAQGYAYAFARNNIPSPNNPTGTPVVFNHLIGQELILNGIESLNYGMNAVSFKAFGANANDQVDNTPNDDDGDGIRDLNGPNDPKPEYEEAPDKILIPRFLGQTPGITDSHLILINLSGGQAFTTVISILGFDDSENPFSATYQFYCWARPSLLEINQAFSNLSLLSTSTSPNEILGAPTQKAGWFIVDGLVANSSVEAIQDPAIYAVLIECLGPGHCASDLPWELCSQTNGDLLPVSPLGDGPNPTNGDNQ